MVRTTQAVLLRCAAHWLKSGFPLNSGEFFPATEETAAGAVADATMAHALAERGQFGLKRGEAEAEAEADVRRMAFVVAAWNDHTWLGSESA